MIIRSAAFVKSSLNIEQCPDIFIPEFGFTGRSNVGKSSIINMLTGRTGLAKISGNPGKTRTINHFIINDMWYLVDLPGYGYAKVSAGRRQKWQKATEEYILRRKNLVCLFVLLDPRIPPQKPDIRFMEFLGTNRIPFARVFTKADKLSYAALEKSLNVYNDEMLKMWEWLPETFIASVVKKQGREDILDYIEESINKFSKNKVNQKE